MSSYVLYVVQTEPHGYSTRRRYSDFVWLRETLLKTYPGLFVPALPSDSMSSKIGSRDGPKNAAGDFVRSRMALLDLFCQNICQIPFLRSDNALQAFLQEQQDKDFKAAVERINKSNLAAETTQGAELWRTFIRSSTTMADADRICSMVKRQMEQLRQYLFQLQEDCNTLEKQTSLVAKDMNATLASVNQWSALEADHANPANCDGPVSPHAAEIRLYANALQQGFGHWAYTTQITPKLVTSVLIARLQYQISQVEGFRDLIKKREGLQQELEKAEKEKVKLLEDKTKAAGAPPPSRGFFSSAKAPSVVLDELFQKKEEQVATLSAAVTAMTAGLLAGEIDRFHLERKLAVRALVGSMIAAQVKIIQVTSAKWLQISTTANIDINEFSDQVIDILDFPSTVEDGAAATTTTTTAAAPLVEEEILSADV